MKDATEQTPAAEEAAAMERCRALAQRIATECLKGQLELDACNALMLVIQTVCAASQDMALGANIAPHVHLLGVALTQESVTRQVMSARIVEISAPPGEGEELSAAAARKQRVH